MKFGKMRIISNGVWVIFMRLHFWLYTRLPFATFNRAEKFHVLKTLDIMWLV